MLFAIMGNITGAAGGWHGTFMRFTCCCESYTKLETRLSGRGVGLSSMGCGYLFFFDVPLAAKRP